MPRGGVACRASKRGSAQRAHERRRGAASRDRGRAGASWDPHPAGSITIGASSRRGLGRADRARAVDDGVNVERSLAIRAPDAVGAAAALRGASEGVSIRIPQPLASAPPGHISPSRSPRQRPQRLDQPLGARDLRYVIGHLGRFKVGDARNRQLRPACTCPVPPSAPPESRSGPPFKYQRPPSKTGRFSSLQPRKGGSGARCSEQYSLFMNRGPPITAGIPRTRSPVPGIQLRVLQPITTS